jgi:hypothetical protein
MVPPDYFNKRLAFYDKCYTMIFYRQTKAYKSSCASNADCYTACDKRGKKCAFPKDANEVPSPAPPLPHPLSPQA